MNDPKVILVRELPTANPTYNHAVRLGDTIYVSGQIGIDPDTGTLVAGGQLSEYRQALQNLETILRAAGTSLRRVVKTTIYMTDVSQLTELNRIYAEFFPETPPAKTGVEVNRLALGARIEIEAIAAADVTPSSPP
jgi:2-iminobutanoate/2-iminopropanoate deaminase